MTFKQQAMAYIQELPEDCTEQALHDFLDVRRAIQVGQQAINEGRVVSQEEIDEMVRGWTAE